MIRTVKIKFKTVKIKLSHNDFITNVRLYVRYLSKKFIRYIVRIYFISFLEYKLFDLTNSVH